jgi:hypothetical protein
MIVIFGMGQHGRLVVEPFVARQATQLRLLLALHAQVPEEVFFAVIPLVGTDLAAVDLGAELGAADPLEFCREEKGKVRAND